MAQHSRCSIIVATISQGLLWGGVFFILGMFLVKPAAAQEKCNTVKDCALEMVAVANDLKKENAALFARIVDLEKALTKHSSDMNSRIEKLKTGAISYNFPGGNGQSSICPAGTFMAGARWQSDSGGSHGQISWFAPICRVLP